MLGVLGLLPLAVACHHDSDVTHRKPRDPPFSCPVRYGCVPRPDKAPAHRAPAPYARCAASLEPPPDAGMTLDSPDYSSTAPKAPAKVTVTHKVAFSPGFTKEVRNAHTANKMDHACCYEWTIPCGGGRPYRVQGRIRTAVLEQSGDYLLAHAGGLDAALPDLERDELGAHWRRAALFEHASIASFERFAAQLAQLAAPRRLVDDALSAAHDELEHARLCFSLAWRFDGRRLGPGELPAAHDGATLEQLVEETFFDGCVEETVAAAVADRAAGLAKDREVRRTLRRIARDEQRHAELAFRTLAWAVGAGAGHALARCVARLRGALPVRHGTAIGKLAPFGHPGPAFEHAVRAEALQQVVVPCAEAILAAAARPAAARSAGAPYA